MESEIPQTKLKTFRQQTSFPETQADKIKAQDKIKKKTPKESARNTKFCTINMSIYVTGLQPKSSTIFHQKMYKYT